MRNAVRPMDLSAGADRSGATSLNGTKSSPTHRLSPQSGAAVG